MYWYPIFSNLEGISRCTVKTEIIKLPDKFVDYLGEDGIILPKFPDDLSMSPYDPRFDGDEKDTIYNDISDYSSEETNSSQAEEHLNFDFHELEKDITQTIKSLGGSVFVKLNWTSPQDCSWMFGTLMCKSSGQVISLLKASDLIQHDLNFSYQNCYDALINADKSKDIYLILKKWCNLNPSQEFRCFVVESELVFVCQRNVTQFFPHYLENSFQAKIVCQVTQFFHSIRNFLLSII